MTKWLFGFWMMGLTACAWADLAAELTPEQWTELKEGEAVVKSEDLPGYVWPRLTVYKIVNATPAELMALFADYKTAPDYTPGMISAKVTEEPKPNVKNVNYVTKVPVLGKISYDVQNTFSKNKVSWTLIQSPVAKSSTGSLSVEPYGKNESLLRYINLVEPVTKMAGFLKGQARTEAINTMNVLTTEAEKRAANK